MPTTTDKVQRLKSFNDTLEGADPELITEAPPGRNLEVTRPPQEELVFESIALRKRRPVLAVREDQAILEFKDVDDAALWMARLQKAREALTPALRAVGRIDVPGHPDFAWVGTGWLIDEDVLVTNRHVAELFADGIDLVFNQGVDPKIDFAHEFDSPAVRSFKLLRPLHIEPRPGPDVAFLRIEKHHDLASPIRLAAGDPTEQGMVSVLGYPARDSRIPDIDLMEEIYGSRYDQKRLAPGTIKGWDRTRILHDCTTLGGNSGSVVLDLESGKAVGLHYSGAFLVTNHAVRADVVEQLRKEVLEGRVRPGRRVTPARGGDAAAAPPSSARSADAPSAAAPATFTFTVPLHVTVSLGIPTATGAGPSAPSAPSSAPQRRPGSPVTPAPAQRQEDIEEEAVAADYADRTGYDPDFLGTDAHVPLPKVVRHRSDVLKFELDGREESELRYEHFSVVMRESRRLCFFSAANIDGPTSARKTKRAGWRTDPRIPKSAQIIQECYGDPPKFSRGHMTRREDPAWGDATSAERGNRDSMHVTNAVPQMQAFNSPIWLELEDYALGTARSDKMRVSVFTGPYFDHKRVADKPSDHVLIPRAFWKVIAFLHEETGELCATGYEMSQVSTLPAEEGVFGDFVSSHLNVSAQVPLRTIEARSGLSFGDLASYDPLGSEEESVGSAERGPLLSLSQIRFV